jgi:hypothetical protein
LVEYYRSIFSAQKSRGGAQAEWITDPDEISKLTAFFAWTAWTATANRPGYSYSYTNNWPPEPLAGNFITADAITWSVISIIGLLGGIGLILYFFGRYDWLGWGRWSGSAGRLCATPIRAGLKPRANCPVCSIPPMGRPGASRVFRHRSIS